GLEEPPYLPIIEKDPGFLELFEEALERGKVITGHGCGLGGRELQAYRLMGAASDHECTTGVEAREKARVGQSISMREGSGASDVVNVCRAVTELGVDPRCFTFCGDEVEFLRLYKLGHLDYNLRLAVAAGVGPVRAVQMATINAAQLLGVDREMGSIAPGKLADLVLVEDLQQFKVRTVLVGGRPVVENGEFVAELKRPRYPRHMYRTVRLKRPLRLEDFAIPAPPGARRARVRVIGVTDGSLISDRREAWLEVRDGEVRADPGQDVLKIAMVDRYGRWDRVGLGFIQGFNLKRGAIGSTYNPLYENIVTVGADDRDLLAASRAIASMGGGFVAVDGGEVVGKLALPLFGLLSDETLEAAAAQMEQVYAGVREMGCKLKKGPFHTLAFMCACGEIGHLKICHEGLFDVEQRRVVDTVLEWE
ncbi:MAG: amidohydrolase family protein, partial [Acetobacteraceae bacterium]|nr:amidohydrolase family protein [Acetobacteraceae bacterium]